MIAFFVPPVVISAIALAGVYFVGGMSAFFIAILLSVLEITLSFDNAVVNARVLERMSREWQRRFLTWGMLIAVFGTRVLFPILVVSATVWASPLLIAQLAVFDPAEYASLLKDAHYAINAFGAAFLLMVSLRYFMDESKEHHWIHAIERTLARLGRIESIEIMIVLVLIGALTFLVPVEGRFAVLIAGIVGIGLFVFFEMVMQVFARGTEKANHTGLVLFLYLNILDSAFSLDSVVGAFALSTSILVIGVGLGIGAYFVRALTVYLVERRTLASLVYLEHGAHWAIMGLAFSMLASLLFDVPDIITGGIGLAFVLAAYYSSLLFNRRKLSI